MAEYLGNTSHLVDWNKFIKELEQVEPMVGYQFEEDRKESIDPAVAEVRDLWLDAGYVANSSKDNPLAWEAWYSGVHFDSSITDILCKELKITPIDVSMVTRLIPGRFAPWHWDIRNQETIDKFNSYNKEIVRVHIHMNSPEPGHVFQIDDHVFYNEEQGSMYKWPTWMSWHGGANCGLKPKYQYSIIGVTND